MNNIEEILTFCVNLSRHMIVSGANLERVSLAIEFVAKAYKLKDLSVFLLSNHISISAYDKDGNYASRQASIPPAGINLERLRNLNQLSYKIAEITPSPKVLDTMLTRALKITDYPDYVILLGRIGAMSSLCFMFGGSFATLIPVALVTVLLHFLMIVFESTGLDRILINSLTMWFSSVAAIFLIYVGVGTNLASVLITVSMLVIPGIPLVNAMRNLLCGRENNGILQMLKIFIETMALGLGIFVALEMFKGYAMINEISTSPLNPYLLILLSFSASACFGITFRIPIQDLWLAGLGGALTRIALISFSALIPNRLIFMTISASIAGLYAEYLAVQRRQPSIYFVYPSIIPLIPGDLFFYSLSGLFLGDSAWVKSNGVNCILSLLGLSMGFVLSSTVSHYVRKRRYVGRHV